LPEEEEESVGTGPAATRRVLVVDDEEDIREVAQLGLETFAGWHVRTAASGPQAVREAAADPPDVVLLDVMMPELDGPSTLAALREDPATHDVPVVFLTAKVQPTERRRLEHLASGVIAKPFDPVALAGEIADRLGWPAP
jgi:CheY-like chemotaxis protein